MAKIKLTKGELKRRRDALSQYQRYLPTLQLKKQQLQIEILHLNEILQDRRPRQERERQAAKRWAGLLTDAGHEMKKWLAVSRVVKGMRNVAGVNLPVFEDALFEDAAYDLFLTPLWVDAGLEALRRLGRLREEIGVLEEAGRILRDELRVTTQRVNLFEKVKIPEAQEAIRAIKIYIGDQMTNAVGRSKIAKRKIEAVVYEAAAHEVAA